jgi:hypothetical protein
MVTLYEQKTESLEPSTYDPLTLMWQAYFTPPVDDVQDITVATTRRVGHHTLTREADETIAWSQGRNRDRALAAHERRRQHGHHGLARAVAALRAGEDAPETNYKSLFGATLEATLDSIRVDETLARQ